MDTLEIVIVSAGMPFAAETLNHKSLGGSETAALCLAKELKAKGHIVSVFTPMPPEGEPDFLPSGAQGDDGVRYVGIEQYAPFVTSTEVDLLIVQRAPDLLKLNHQARRSVLWVHDLATYNGPSKTIADTAWLFDEVWAVSEWHGDQYAKVTGYPREHIKVLYNALSRQEIMEYAPKAHKQLFFAARPERGMEPLVRPGGIMSRLPGYTLKIAMYANFSKSMQPYYDQLFEWARELPNVEFIGSLTNGQVRQMMHDSEAYIYPTDHEETSCILMREAMEQNCPVLYRDRGALKETLGDYGEEVISEHPYNSDGFCADWAMAIENAGTVQYPNAPEPRYWSDAADDALALYYSMNRIDRPIFSLLRSLVEDSDIVPAIALIETLPEKRGPALQTLIDQVEQLYPYLYGRESFAAYYERYFVREDSKGARQRRSMVGNPRFEAIAAEVAETPPYAVVIDYGCAEGVIILDLAQRFPTRTFIGIDFAATNVALCQEYAGKLGLNNVEFYVGSTDDWPLTVSGDAVICTEVLEHVTEPWKVIGFLEKKVLVGGRVITTVPMGPWEAIGLYNRDQFYWRAHIWHINKWMLRTMFADKTHCRMSSMPGGASADGHALGHLTFSYEADHSDPLPIDPLEKVARHRERQSVTAAMVVNDPDMLMRTLKSIHKQVHVVNIMVTTGTDDTDILHLAEKFAAEHPWVIVNTRFAPAIEPYKYGFDDARNDSIRETETNWVLWIDSDEYLSGDLTKYLRNNAFDSYAVHQHHFTCDPRGAPAQLDKPARLIRTDRGFSFYGKVHEHAERGLNGGPGFCMVLPDVDIGHVGYTNERTRRDRFSRNFPFLEWDHNVNPDRHLSKFLWLRDLVQRMRYYAEQQDVTQARLLAEAGVSYYREEWKDWDAPGMGGDQALQYYSEALSFLGRGMPIQLQMDMGDEKGVLTGVFESEDEVAKVVMSALKDKFSKRNSGYWQ